MIDKKTRKNAILKKIFTESSIYPTAAPRQKTIKLFELLRRINHPNIVRIDQIYTHKPDGVFVTMEDLNAGSVVSPKWTTLSQVLKQRRGD